MPNNSIKALIAFLSIFMLTNQQLFSQIQHPHNSIKGTVYEIKNGKLIPLRQATIKIEETGAVASTNASGEFELNKLPGGQIKLQANYVGKVTIDTIINLSKNADIQLIFQDNSFKLTQVDIIAQRSNKSQGTGSVISSNAIEHLQATSLADVMSLLPGGLTTNPDLNGSARFGETKQLNLRAVANTSNISGAFGTSIVVNGSPVANNANLQSMDPMMSGGTSSMSGGAAPGAGFDVRSIPVQNIESVEVIRGVPGVEYGDITTGTVIINQKAGKQPLIVNASTNPNVNSISASKGFDLGNKSGALNVSADYAHNISDPVQSYIYYQRANVNALYSNDFFNKKLSSTTILNVNMGKDSRDQNPDDQVTMTKSSAKQLGFNLTTAGNYKISDKWLNNIRYSGSIGLTNKDSYLQEQYTAANAPYSQTYSDGVTLTNFPGRNLFDKEGKQITNIPSGEENKYAVYLPSTYVGEYNINGKEFNAYFKTIATFFNQIGQTNHRWMIGADFKTDKNFGDGKTFSDALPPYRSAVFTNSSFRQRKFSDIPALNQVGLFAEENFSAKIGQHELNILAGLRYDRFSLSKSALSPRINAYIDVVPEVLTLRGGFGILAKAPSLLYAYPEDAYFEYININELASSSIPVDERVFMTTTHVFSTTNMDLKIAKNQKAEIGFDLNIGKSKLRVTGFDERLKDGYNIGSTINSYMPVQYTEYKRVTTADPVYSISASNPVLARFNMPNNNSRLDKKGIELELDLPRIDAIRTQFSLYGAYIKQKSYSSDYFFYDGQSSTGGAGRTHIGLYAPGMTAENDKSAVTTLRTVHNIPRIGFVISLTTEVIWNKSSWTAYGNDSIPVKYIDKRDGLLYDFDVSRKDEPEFKTLLRPVSRPLEMVESLSPMINFNINVTKEIKDFLRISFFANNLFRSYKIDQSDQIKSNYYKRNIPFYFGLNLGLIFK